MKELIRARLKAFVKCKYRISVKEPPKEIMDKKLFVESIKLLREIDDRTDFLQSEIGMDMTEFENKFFMVIENLLKLHFSKDQLALIQYFIYQIPHEKEFEGMIEIQKGNKTIEVKFETPEHLWEAIQKL